jgi:hypothetical protein
LKNLFHQRSIKIIKKMKPFLKGHSTLLIKTVTGT